MLNMRYSISSKYGRGEIWFQGPVWCSDNSRAARFQGRHLKRSTHKQAHSFNNEPICMQVHVQCVCTYIFYSCQPCTKQQDFKGGVCWDELAEICSDILRVAGIQGVARFRGNTVIMMKSNRCTECLWRVVGTYMYNLAKQLISLQVYY